MTRSLWLRFVAISVLFALLLSGAYLLLVRQTTGDARDAILRSVYLFMAHLAEEEPYGQAMKRINALLAESPAVPAELWVVDEGGRVLASRSTAAPPLEWMNGERPQQVHDVKLFARIFRAAPELAVVRLHDAAPTYLVVRNLGLPGRPILLLQSAFFIVTIAAAMFLGLVLITLYLRGRSREARAVIARIEGGDLRARFEPDRLDALGQLMLDFNRMADEIERLVQRLRETEVARRGLLQELGHDLRTPLTSLRTAVETLGAHSARMSDDERNTFAAIARSELEYFVRLLDDLFFIAEIAEPRYRADAQDVDLRAVLGADLQAVQQGDTRGLRFVLDAQPAWASGDAGLLSRVFRNAIDNAAKHAHREVRVGLRTMNDDTVEVVVQDDGEGMTAEQIAHYGARRSQRIQTARGDLSMSLGLGSVIIKTIVELHGGRVELHGRADGVGGTQLRVRLPIR